MNLDSASKRNDEVDWDTFDSTWYRSHNYGKIRPEDREIVQRIRDFFAESFADSPPPAGARGLDVGPGSNLYPSFAMLPFCDHLDLWEYSATNVRWLRRQQRWWHRLDRRWNGFWRLFSENVTYRKYAATHRPLAEFARKAIISQQSIFALPRNSWDAGTMFFVACSISGDQDEFDLAVRCFLRSLRPKAPFAIAFMTGSRGYPAGRNRRFPAYPVQRDRDLQSLADLAYSVTAQEIPSSLRDGVGMLLVTGRAQEAEG